MTYEEKITAVCLLAAHDLKHFEHAIDCWTPAQQEELRKFINDNTKHIGTRPLVGE